MAREKSKKTQLFQMQLTGANLTDKQVKQVAAAIRGVTAQQLLSLDFRIEDLTSIIKGAGKGLPEGSSCGGCGCNRP